MALNQQAVIAKVRDVVATVAGIAAAYSAGDSDDTRLPEGITLADGAAALVLPGATVEYILQPGKHRHTYEVVVQVLTGGADTGMVAANMAPMPDRVLEAMLLNVKLGGLVTFITFRRSEGLREFEYGGVEGYSGYELTFLTSEEASAAPAVGS